MRVFRAKPVPGFALFTAMALAAVACHPVPSGLVADYQFQNTRASSVGSAPALSDINHNGTNYFLTDTVDGVERRVLRFPVGNGLRLEPTSGLPIPPDRYTVVILFRFGLVSSYRRVLQTKNVGSPFGLYVAEGALEYNYGHRDIATGHPGRIPANTYVQVAVTRDNNGVVIGYVNGEPQFFFPDSNNYGVIDSGLALRFFDNGSGNESPGRVARIRIWDRALTSDEVADLHRLG